MNFILWLVLGALAGWIASMIMGTNRQQGLLMDVVVGIVGAFLGGFIFNTLFNSAGVTGFNLPSLLVAVVGAVVLLWLIRLVRGRGR
jgi:uncharacterized membrane protein YeaQ/YmgE (transglycosylase-associated protein family)